jgi:uncharacterized membrane protein
MIDTLATLFLTFWVYAFLGWLWETVYLSIRQHRFVYRGFLLGPYCPIYGIAAVIILPLVTPAIGNPVVVFLTSMALATIIEYLGAVLLERAFHMQWWSYSDRRFNLHGRIAFVPSLVWGLAITLCVYFLVPAITALVNFILQSTHLFLVIPLTLIILADAIFTLIQLSAYRRFVSRARRKHADHDDTERYLSFLLDKLRNSWVPSLNRLVRNTKPPHLNISVKRHPRPHKPKSKS